MPLTVLTAAAFALFWLRTPVENLLGTSAMKAESSEEARTVKQRLRSWELQQLLLGLAVVVRAERRLVAAWCRRGRGFIGQALLKRLGRRAWMLSEMVGTIGLPASAPASYYVITGNVNATT